MARRRVSPRVLAVVVPVCVSGAAALAAAGEAYAGAGHSLRDAGALAAFLGAMILAERFPVSAARAHAGGTTLGFVFAAAAVLLLGWPAGVVAAACGATIANAVRRPPIRTAYRAATLALAALAAGAAVEPVHGDSIGSLLARVAIVSLAYNSVAGLVLVGTARAAGSRRSFVRIAWEHARRAAAPVAFMASAALTLVVLWERSPALSLALAGPMLAIVLYQRSSSEAVRAVRLALTDPLTGLGNHRSFHEQLRWEVTAARREAGTLSLCLVDIDDFKAINDRVGHPAGDGVLVEVASRLRQGGEAFRLGGDEFAVLLPAHDEPQALAAARSIVERVASTAVDGVGSVTVSAGVATYPAHGAGRHELIRLADSALYWAKEDGKNRARAYTPASLLPGDGDRRADDAATRIAV